MSKGKSKWYPNKKANKKGYWCSCCEEIGDSLHCESGVPSHIVETTCKGNPHNCCSVVCRKWAGKSQKDESPKVNNKWDSWSAT